MPYRNDKRKPTVTYKFHVRPIRRDTKDHATIMAIFRRRLEYVNVLRSLEIERRQQIENLEKEKCPQLYEMRRELQDLEDRLKKSEIEIKAYRREMGTRSAPRDMVKAYRALERAKKQKENEVENLEK